MNQKIVVFISLLIDLFAFALILPLFPKIFEYYASNENVTFFMDHTYSVMEYFVNKFRTLIMVSENKSVNLVLFGGAIGSLFSLLQFLSSTIAGAISDIYGRKPVLLFVMFGTLISYIVWSFSSLFIIFLISRIVGGITKANVSLSIAIMTDLSNVDNRSSAMALVGIAFSLGFIMGPSAGAMFSKLFVDSSVFVYPAYLAIFLTSINILFIVLFYKESLPIEKRAKSIKNNLSEALQLVNPVSLFKFAPIKSVKNHELKVLQNIGYANFFYLFLYSGLEFTLTFLVHDRFKYDSAQQGKMFLFIGIVMTLVQGGYVRRIKEGKHIKAAISAIFLLIPGFVIIALAMDQLVFYVGLALYCFSSAVVVQCFTTIISNYGNEDEKGKVTGVGRSIGSLARAFGPFFASMLYWIFGPSFAYIFGGSALVVPLCILIKLERKKIKSN